MDQMSKEFVEDITGNGTLETSVTHTNDSDFSAETLARNLIITISYSLIVLISLCGNILVCKTIWSKTPHNSTNVLIANLAFSDILMTLFNIPFTVVDIVLNDWVFGQSFCVLVPFIQASCVYVSSFTMLVIAVNRYRSIYHTKYRHRQRNRANICNRLIVVIGLIWTAAAVHSVPHTVYNEVRVIEMEPNGEAMRRCLTVAPKIVDNVQLWITIMTFMTQYLIPLSISAVVYIRIGFTIASLGNVCSMISEDQRNQLCYKKRRRILLLVLIVLIFGICWSVMTPRAQLQALSLTGNVLPYRLPFHMYYLLGDFKVTKFNFNIFLVCHWLAMSSVCYNPFVYFWLNESFRNDAKNIIKFLIGMKANTTEENDNQLNNIDVSCFYQNNVTNTTNL